MGAEPHIPDLHAAGAASGEAQTVDAPARVWGRLAPMLEPGERILWAGRPNVRRHVRDGAWGHLVVAAVLLALAAAVFVVVRFLVPGAILPLGEVLLLVSPVAVLALLAASCLVLLDWRMAARTDYILTDQRIASIGGRHLTLTRSIDLSDIANARLARLRDGNGCIDVVTRPGCRVRRARLWHVDEVRQVYEKLLALLPTASTAPAGTPRTQPPAAPAPATVEPLPAPLSADLGALSPAAAEGIIEATWPGETMFWCAGPDPRAATMAALPIVIAVGVALFIPPLLWAIDGAKNLTGDRGNQVIFLSIAAVTALLILGSLVERFFKARQTGYAITNRRVLMTRGLLWKRTISAPLAGLGPLRLRPGADGIGQVFFAPRFRDSAWTGGLRYIPDAEDVHALLASLIRRAEAIQVPVLTPVAEP